MYGAVDFGIPKYNTKVSLLEREKLKLFSFISSCVQEYESTVREGLLGSCAPTRQHAEKDARYTPDTSAITHHCFLSLMPNSYGLSLHLYYNTAVSGTIQQSVIT